MQVRYSLDDFVQGIVALEADEMSLIKAVVYGHRRYLHTVDRRQLSRRRPAERFESIVRGEVVTNALLRYLHEEVQFRAIGYDDLRADRFEMEDPGWDIWYRPSSTSSDERVRSLRMSVKSSTIPEQDGTLEQAIARRDIKILKYAENVEDDLPFDVVAQAYLPTAARTLAGVDLERVEGLISGASLSPSTIAQLIDELRLFERCGYSSLVAVATKEEIVRHVTGLTSPTDFMPIGGGLRKEVWNTKIVEVGHPGRILQFIRSE